MERQATLRERPAGSADVSGTVGRAGADISGKVGWRAALDGDAPQRRAVPVLLVGLGEQLLDHLLQLGEGPAGPVVAGHDLPVVGRTRVDVPDHAALIDQKAH